MGILIGVGNTLPKFPYDYYYGVSFDTTIPNPSCTRIGRPELHVTLPIQSRMRRCLLNDNGTVNYYLHPNDSTLRDTGAPADLTGAAGQVMVEIPEHYRKFEQVGTKISVFLSEHPLPGFHLVPKAYRSAYEATVQQSTSKLCSVVNTSADFRGGHGDPSWDNQSKTLLGRPKGSLSLTNFRAYARNRGAYGKNGAGWNCDLYELQKTCYWLFVVEYATLNSQADYNAQPTAEGYKQGGLGAGVTTLGWDAWNAFNSYSPFVPCGHTNSLGNRTGVVNFTMPPEYGTNVTVQVPSYRGIENIFGHIWKWTDGCKFLIQSDADGGLSKFYVGNNPALFQDDNNFDGYELRGNIPRVEGFIKEMMVGEFCENMPKALGADSVTYFCDYNYTTIPSSGVAIRGLLLGAAAANGATAGLVYSASDYAPAYTSTAVGSRLCFVP
jgi:hypothetical protein